ncbi:hypothetical protein [Ornithinimicrobium pratense]|uniref:Uncharacterized protein n=1 Tax=Ornithinimicrobium pratense TaxID=2593973 RepID=A0A5J6V2D3_9MICO|nr:hypothetical protein [Ornithinimicrobium pratense]QFG67865.1 hypothetical protein FY030_03215 [Ornithinimicrobium pratense]
MPQSQTHEPGPDDFRALARSSPWLFATLHWRHGRVEAWLDRPSGRVTVRDADGRVEVAEGAPYSTSRLSLPLEDGEAAPDEAHPADPVVLAGGRLGTHCSAADDGVVRRADGLVLARPRDWHYEHGDPMWGNYLWTAMLDPVELADGVEPDADLPPQDVPGVLVSEVQDVTHRGRRTWQAICRPVVDAYDPRCGCCPLLDSVASRLQEYGPDDPNLVTDGLPTAYLVSLDLRTGIVVDVSPLDGTTGSSLTNEIYAVDEALSPPPAGP